MTYEYVCQACGHQWEAEQSIKERPLRKCVSCGEEQAKRLVSGGTGFLLKGGGWYADLYSSAGASKSISADDKPAKPANGGDAKPANGGGATESKPAPAPKPAAGSSAASTAGGTAAPAAASAKAG